MMYNIGIIFYGLVINIASIWSPKARKWVHGRKSWEIELKSINPDNKKLIWFHCASLGEFEQGRPLIDLIKAKHPDIFIALTFFSPSGFDIRKGYKKADWVGYMPLDTPRNAAKFISILNPELSLFIKYEFWHNYLRAMQKQGLPYIFVSSIFRPNHYLLKNYNKPLLNNLRMAEQIFVQDKESESLLLAKSLSNVHIVGDTRIDQVLLVQQNANNSKTLESFSDGFDVFIIGSSWPEDDEILIPFINSLPNRWKVIIAPHTLNQNQISKLMDSIKKKIVKFSTMAEKDAKATVLILDTIGHLSKSYSLAKMAYVGGGFGSGIHNILEPMAAGLPVIFGPKYQKFKEAAEIIDTQGGYCIHDTKELNDTFTNLLKEEKYNLATNANNDYLNHNKGATQLIYNYIIDEKLLKD